MSPEARQGVHRSGLVARRLVAHGVSCSLAVRARGPRRFCPCDRPTLADGLLRLVVRVLVRRCTGWGACGRGCPVSYQGGAGECARGGPGFCRHGQGRVPRARGGGVSQSSSLLLGRNCVPARQVRHSVDLMDAHLAHACLWHGFVGGQGVSRWSRPCGRAYRAPWTTPWGDSAVR